MERADVGRAVAEQAHHGGCIGAGRFLIFQGEGGTGRRRNLAADDAVTAEQSRFGVEKVHGTAASARHAGSFTEQLSHHPLG